MPTIQRLLHFLRPFRRQVALAVILGFVTVASGIALLMTSAWLIAAAALQPSIADLQVAIVGVRFFGISRGVFRYLERVVSHQVNFKLLAELRTWFYDKLEPLAPARLQRYRSGDLLARIVADVDTLENFYVRVVAPPLVALLVLALMWLLLGQFSLLLPAALTGFLLLAGLGLPLLASRLGREPGRQLVTVRSQLNASLVDGIQGLADLLAHGAERSYAAQVAELGDETAFWQRRMARISAFQTASLGLLASLAAVVGLAIAIPLVEQGRLDAVNLAVIALGVMASFEAVAPLPLAGQYLEQSLAAARRLFEVTMQNAQSLAPAPARAPKRSAGASVTDYGSRTTDHEFAIRHSPLSVSDLRFRYGPGEPWALDGISFQLLPGRTVAIVGASGAGKSTLVNLLLRFWEAQDGEVTLDGRPLSQLDPGAARAFFSVVAQDTYLFNATIRENLRIARPEAGDDELAVAARQAQIHDFVQALPGGYETWIGEQGLRLSGGQRQRLAIARAILKDAPILILDEPTANLDPVSERAVMDTLRRATAGRSTLLITHQLAGLEHADEILVLAAGRIVERGSHRDLLQLDGHYRRMWELQRGQLAG